MGAIREILSKKLMLIAKIVVFTLLIVIMYFLGMYLRRNDPLFQIKQVYIRSSAGGNEAENNPTKYWNLNLFQDNQIYINLGLREDLLQTNNPNRRIKSVSIENVKLSSEPSLLGTLKLYKISTDKDKLFEYIPENQFQNRLDYFVTELKPNVYENEVGVYGGQLNFAVVNENLLSYKYENEEEIIYDGTLLAKANIEEKDIKFKVYFDVVLVTESNKKYIANIEMNLPYGNILENGTEINKNADIGKFVYSKE